MTRIRAKCPSCGDVEFGIDAIVVVIGTSNSDVDEEYGGRAYRFSCPRCATSVRRAAVADVIELLITAGVRVEPSAIAGPEPVRQPPPRSRYPTLTDADVDAFRELLAGPDWFEQLKSFGD